MEGVDVGDTSEQSGSEFAQVTNRPEKRTDVEQSYANAGPSNLLTNSPSVDDDIGGNYLHHKP